AHLESLTDPNDASSDIEYGELSVFVRLGTDFDNNYYEYELPLVPTDRRSGTKDESLIWPDKNNIIIEFEKLTNAKLKRNAENFNQNLPYYVSSASDRITVKGNPVLNDVRTIMIGVRKLNKANNPFIPLDRGREAFAEVWVNELRLTDFDEFGGWAAIARMNVKMADFGNLSVAANMSTPGFGSVEKRLSERQRETKKGIDASSNLELGKFLPEKSGIKIPVFFGYSESHIDPMYDPLIPDVEFSRTSEGLTAKEKRDRLRVSQTFNKRRSVNFTNVRKDRVDANQKAKIYDIENFSFTYSYAENFFRDINTSYRFNKNYRGGFSYGFQNKPRTITPFKDIGVLNKSKYLALLSDFNFNIGPKQIAFRTNIDRDYTEQQVRNNIPYALDPIPTYTKTFNWQRGYDFKYDLTRSLSLDFSANNNAYIKETPGRVNRDDREAYQTFKDTVWNNIKNLGQTTNYMHTTNLTYKLPFKKFPLTDWVDGSATYGSSYQWDRAPFSQDTLGNTIQNSRTTNLDFQGNMLTLYNKVPYLKAVINKKNKAAAANNKPANPKVPVPGAKPTVPDSLKTKKEKVPTLNFPERIVSVLMMTKNASVTFKRSDGTLLPGFSPYSKILGMSPDGGGGDAWAPGAGFVFGQQDENFFDKAAERKWLVQEPDLFQPASRTKTTGRSFRASLEPVKSMRVELNSNVDYTENLSEFFRYSDSSQTWEHQSPMIRGNYSISTITIASMFSKDQKPNFSNEVFDEMIKNTYIMSSRVAAANSQGEIVDSTGYFKGYSKASQEVLIPSFLAAYSGKDPNKQRLNPLSQRALPNWRITYDGLSKLPMFQKYFKTITLSHAYRSTYSTSYTTNLQANEDGVRKTSGIYQDFVPEKQIQTANISEQLSPLIKIDATLKNSLNAQFEIIKDRTVGLSLSNLQVTEVKGTEFKFGSGYRFKNVKFPFKVGTKDIKSDLNVNLTLSVRNNITIIRKASELITDPTSGRKIIAIKMTADYNVSQRVTLRAYYDRTVTKPVLSIPFPNYVSNGGISIRFILAG
ncbi:MAG: cell surface protein SprA, partial [Bacteroidota bacterium]